MECNAVSTLSLPKLSVLDSWYGIANNCSSLTALAVPLLTSLGRGITQDCMNVASVYISNDVLHSISDGQIITPTSADSEWLWISPKIDHIQNNTITILPGGDYAKNIKYIDCQNVVSVGMEFNQNMNLQYVNLPAISVADMTFTDCGNLLSLDFSSAKFLFCNPDDLYRSDEFLVGCSSLTAIKLPEDGLRSIGYDWNEGGIFADTPLYKDQVFAGKQVFELNGKYCLGYIDDSISSYENSDILFIGQESFYGTSIESVDCPNCKVINDGAFYETNIHTADFSSVEFIDGAAFGYTLLSNITCPHLKELGADAFDSCALSSLNIPECSSIASYPFSGNTYLTSIHVDNDVLHSIENGYGIPDTLVVNADETELVSYAPGIERIRNNTIQQLQDGLYIANDNIVDVQLDALQHTTHTDTFVNCSKLSSASLSGVEYLIHRSFYDCNNLSLLNIASIEQFNYYALYNCRSLLSIVMSALTAVPTIVGSATQGPWYGLNYAYKVYVNQSIYDDMISTGWWNSISSRIVAL